MFGVDLTTFSLAHGTMIPPVVQAAIKEVSESGHLNYLSIAISIAPVITLTVFSQAP